MRISRPTIVAVVFVALALAGCGDDKSLSSGRTTGGPTTPGPAPAGPAAGPSGITQGQPDPTVRAGSSADQAVAGGNATGTPDDAEAPAQGEAGGASTLQGEVTPRDSPVQQALQILGIPALALPGAALVPTSPAGAGVNSPTGGAISGSGSPVAPGAGGAAPAGTTGPFGPFPVTGGSNTPAPPTGGGSDTPAPGTGGSQSPIPTTTAFCGPARALDSALQNVGASAEDPAALRGAVGKARSAFTQARAAAPPALAGDVDVLARAYGQLFDGMEAAGYQLSRMSPGAFQGMLAPEVETSSERLRNYVTNVC